MQGALDCIDADTVAEETRRIEAGHHTLAELLLAKLRQRIHHRGVGMFAAYQFEQAHEAYRVEEVRDREAFTKVFGHILD